MRTDETNATIRQLVDATASILDLMGVTGGDVAAKVLRQYGCDAIGKAADLLHLDMTITTVAPEPGTGTADLRDGKIG